MKKIRSCVIGTGFIGLAHVEALRRLGFVEVVAICNIIDCRAIADRICVPKAYDDYRLMIDEEKPDVVHVCTPNATHFEIACYAMNRGIHVMCEKPLAFNTQQAEEMLRLANEKGIINAVNFHCRYYPLVRQMRELVLKKEIGPVISVHGGYLQDWLLLDTDYSWRLENRESGASRAVADIGSHWVDAVEFITGLRIKRVFADFAIFHKTRKKPMNNMDTFSGKLQTVDDYEVFEVNTEDFAQALIEFNNGAKGNMIVSQMYAGRKNQMTISVAGKEKALYFDSEALNELWLGSRKGYNSIIVKDPALLESGANTAQSYPGGHAEGFPDAFVHNFRAFYQNIISGIKSEYATFADGLREMQICEAMVTSSSEGRWVQVGE